MSRPYGEAWQQYLDAGWHPFPLPRGSKIPPPVGATGGAPAATQEQLRYWAENEAGGNIGIRPPLGVLGLDVDAYDGKNGAFTLAGLEGELGPLPPTARLTSRDDGVSGIRFFRVPEDVRWPGEAVHHLADGTVSKGIETIRWGHRYAVATPSVHPEGGTYRWLDADGEELTGVPAVVDLPELPASWVQALRQGSASPGRAGVGASPQTAWSQLEGGLETSCPGTRERLAAVRQALRSGSRHEAARDGCLKLLRAAQEGHLGIVDALRALRQDFVSAVADRPGDYGTLEWERLYAGACNLVGKPSGSRKMCDCVRAAYRLALAQSAGFSKGIGGASQREVLHLMVGWARGGWNVRASQRQIGNELRRHQPSIQRTQRALVDGGWLKRPEEGDVGEGWSHSLLLHPVLVGLLSAEKTTQAGSSADNSTTTSANLLFARVGLGRGMAETLSALPVMGRRIGKRSLGLAMPAARPPEGRDHLDPVGGADRPLGRGQKVKEIVAATGKSDSTVRRHLRGAEAHHLAVRDSSGRWWRFSFDAAEVAREYEVVDNKPKVRAKHLLDQLDYYGKLAREDSKQAADDPAYSPRMVIADLGLTLAAVDASNGTVLAEASTAEQRRWLLEGRPRRRHLEVAAAPRQRVRAESWLQYLPAGHPHRPPRLG